jgi:hypothetical protein
MFTQDTKDTEYWFQQQYQIEMDRRIYENSTPGFTALALEERNEFTKGMLEYYNLPLIAPDYVPVAY